MTKTKARKERIYAYSVDYRKEREESGRVNRGFWVHNLPRLMPLCRLLGHKPVVDGVDYSYHANDGERHNKPRWVCCDRCGIRVAGKFDASDLSIGARWTGPLPGPWTSAIGEVGGQLVLLGGSSTVGVEVKIGHAGSEHTLAAHVHLGKLGALYLHTEGFGTGLQRWLNPTGYESRVTGFDIMYGRFYGQIWAKRNSSSHDDPRWQRWSFPVDPRDILFGPRRYRHENVGDPVQATVWMPHGDDHQVTLQLQREAFGRDRLKRRRLSWMAKWRTRPGIPTKPHGGRVLGSGVRVPDGAVRSGTWPAEACAAIATDMTADRTRYRFKSVPDAILTD
jgi:hypothetical protein